MDLECHHSDHYQQQLLISTLLLPSTPLTMQCILAKFMKSSRIWRLLLRSDYDV